MLYEFHRKQNAKTPGTVDATYLITGLKKPEQPVQTNGKHGQDGEDTVMQSSPPLPSSSAPKPEEDAEEPVPIRSVMLVKEEHLEEAKDIFESITGIHVYSLQCKGLSDVQVLTECNRKIAASYASEDPMQAWKQYGTIQNPDVRRRTQGRPPPAPAPLANNAEAKTKPFAPTKQPVAPKPQDSKAGPKPSSAKATPEPEQAKTTKPAAVKRQDSNLFKSFAKSKTKQKRTDTESSAEASPAVEPADDALGTFSDDDKADEDAEMEDADDAKGPTGKSKNERKADLEAMMAQEDEPMDDATTPTAEAEVEHDGTTDKPESQPAEEPKETVTVEGGRRRGRRRVMKRKTVKDKDGYLGKSAIKFALIASDADMLQSRKKKQLGSRSRKTSQLPRRSRCLRRRA